MDWECREHQTYRSPVQIILLDINSIDGDVAHNNVAISDVGDETCGVVVRLDPSPILGVDDYTLRELQRCQNVIHTEREENTHKNVRDVVVALPAHRSDTHAVSPRAVKIMHCNIVATSNSNTIILIVDDVVVNHRIVSCAYIKAVRIMCCR